MHQLATFVRLALLPCLMFAACKGEPGEPGAAGPQGVGCTAVDNGNGTKTITCEGSAPVTVASGQNGSSCTVVDDGDGGKTIRCEDGTVVTVTDGQAGAPAAPCTVADAGNGTATVRCPDGTTVTYAVPLCGNGLLEAGEACDDGDLASGDGCSSACVAEAGWRCSGLPSRCLRNEDSSFTVTSAPYDQDSVEATATSDRGSVAVWLDKRNGTDDLYAQKYDRSGTPLWTANGAQVSGGSQQILEFSIAPSLAGGVFVAWANNVGGQVDIKVQHVRSDGTVAFGSSGLTVNTNADTDREPTVLALADGGALVSWWNQGSNQVFVQKISAAGAIVNDPNGISVSTASATWRSGNHWAATAARDFIYLVWTQTSGAQRVFATRVRTDGTLEWGAGGVRVSDSSSSGTTEAYPAAATSGSDLVVVWLDERSRGNASFASAYAQQLDTTGARAWTSDVNVGESGWVSFNNNRLRLDQDGARGVLVSWVDARVYQVNDATGEVYAQRVSPAGHRLWPTGGVPVTTSVPSKRYHRLVADGQGGAYLTWADSVRVGFAQHFSPFGQRLWGDSGIVNPTRPVSYDPAQVVVDGSGQPTFFWSAYGAASDVFGFKKWNAP